MIPSIIIKANRLIILIDWPLNNITANVADNAGIPIATQMATLNLKNKNEMIRTNIKPPKPL